METTTSLYSTDNIDISEFGRRLKRGIFVSVGLGMIGLGIGVLLTLVNNFRAPVSTSIRVALAFPSLEKGLYPDGSKFQATDMLAPDLVSLALKKAGIEGKGSDVTSVVRGAINVVPIIPAGVAKERDRQRAAGQKPDFLVPDEYELTLVLPKSVMISEAECTRLLNELVEAFHDKFQRTYSDLPSDYGNAFTFLKDADFPDFEFILTAEVKNLSQFIESKAIAAKTFRSQSTGLSFQDLLKQISIFEAVRLNNILAPLSENAISVNPRAALRKVEYEINILSQKENLRKEEESIVTSLLARTQERAQNYVVASKSQPAPGSQPLLDQGFIDSLLANDSYNFLVRKALDAGLALKSVQAELAKQKSLQARLVKTYGNSTAGLDQVTLNAARSEIASIEKYYIEIMTKARGCLQDYARQEHANVIRLTMQPQAKSIYAGVVIAAIAGWLAGVSIGLGLSLTKK